MKLDLREHSIDDRAVSGPVSPESGNAREVAPAVRTGKKVVYPALGRIRRHTLFDNAGLLGSDQMPTIARLSPDVVLGICSIQRFGFHARRE